MVLEKEKKGQQIKKRTRKKGTTRKALVTYIAKSICTKNERMKER